jgi:putative transposase
VFERCGERSITAAERLIAELKKCFATAGDPPMVLRRQRPRTDFPSTAIVLRLKAGQATSNRSTTGYECPKRNHWTDLLEARVVINGRHRHWALSHLTRSMRPHPSPVACEIDWYQTTWLHNPVT